MAKKQAVVSAAGGVAPPMLAKPLAWTAATPDEVAMLQRLQGNILKGHGRDFTANIFFTFATNDVLASKRILRTLANQHLTSAHKQLLDAQAHKEKHVDGGPFAHLAMAFLGYKSLGLQVSAPNDDDFRLGMKDKRSLDALADPAVKDWQTEFAKPIHAMVLVADSSEALTAALTKKIVRLITGNGGQIVLVQHGKAVRNTANEGIEHFGYVDGRSQPLMLVEDINSEVDHNGGTTQWDPAFPLSTALVPDTAANDPFSFGSFLIFRKLEQRVQAFKRREQEIADTLEQSRAAKNLPPDDRELAGAMLVGRFEDGTPVTFSKLASEAEPVANNFNYNSDAASRCPFHAHIRKVNPRGTSPLERDHIMTRRGIPFEDTKRVVHPDELPEIESIAEFDAQVAPNLPANGVGLLFMAYNANLQNQFIFTQSSWANNPNFPAQGVGIDPVIGQTPANPADHKLPTDWDNPALGTTGNVAFSGFVTMRGGEYLFSPSLTFLRNL
jgi:Dyp-type peroxidase family